MTEDEMVRQHHQLNGDEFEQTPGMFYENLRKTFRTLRLNLCSTGKIGF